jgi:hypothetical protein
VKQEKLTVRYFQCCGSWMFIRIPDPDFYPFDLEPKSQNLKLFNF